MIIGSNDNKYVLKRSIVQPISPLYESLLGFETLRTASNAKIAKVTMCNIVHPAMHKYGLSVLVRMLPSIPDLFSLNQILHLGFHVLVNKNGQGFLRRSSGKL